MLKGVKKFCEKGWKKPQNFRKTSQKKNEKKNNSLSSLKD